MKSTSTGQERQEHLISSEFPEVTGVDGSREVTGSHGRPRYRHRHSQRRQHSLAESRGRQALHRDSARYCPGGLRVRAALLRRAPAAALARSYQSALVAQPLCTLPNLGRRKCQEAPAVSARLRSRRRPCGARRSARGSRLRPLASAGALTRYLLSAAPSARASLGPARPVGSESRTGRRPRGAVSGGGERSQMEESDRWWREVVSDGGEQSQVEGIGFRWRGAVSGGGELSQVEGTALDLLANSAKPQALPDCRLEVLDVAQGKQAEELEPAFNPADWFLNLLPTCHVGLLCNSFVASLFSGHRSSGCSSG